MSGAKSKSNGVRRRGRGRSTVSPKSTKRATSHDDEGDKSTTETPAPQPQSSSAWDPFAAFKSIIGITLVVMLPYALYNAYLYVCLQRPEWISSWSEYDRPSFRVGDARQLLVVGTMSSGTTQVAHDLRTKLDLEIGHENSETNWSFVRDGTISWFHGIRFVPRPGIDDRDARLDLVIPLPSVSTTATQANHADEIDAAPATKTVTLEGETLFRYLVSLMCRDLHPNMGFHPFMFRDKGQCSHRQTWSKCWKDECTNLLEQEWGCAIRQGSSSSCTTPYRKTLHQVRNPLKTVESLVTKFCIGGVGGELQLPFVVFANSLFPSRDFSAMSCIEASGYYVYEYNRAILEATRNGHIDASFRVEDATPCQIATLAGFLGEDGTEIPEGGYQQRIRDHLLNLCSTSDSEVAACEANQPMVSTKNKYNQGQLSLDWDDLLGGRHGSQKKQGDRDLQERLKKLEKELGYR